MHKAVITASSFLWKKAENNPILEKMKVHLHTELHDYLTPADAMQLYKNRLVDSEVLYGTVVNVIAEVGEFSQVEVIDQTSKDNKGYLGYISTADLIEVDDHYGQAAVQIALITAAADLTFAAGQRRKISFGTVLDLVDETASEYQVNTPTGIAYLKKKDCQKTNSFAGRKVTANMIQLAEQFMDLPYVWAGISGQGFDCSGFVYSLHRVNGILIPRDADDQAVCGKRLTYEKAQAGDLLFFAYEEGKGFVHHVGLYLGNDEMIHSQTPGSKVIKTKITGSKYEPELAAVSRFW
ncbi:MAG TPA: C40 family peptidase [Tetragenococcus sp.]|nr:C40 family peptidase [Tetragenococcus sp.]